MNTTIIRYLKENIRQISIERGDNKLEILIEYISRNINVNKIELIYVIDNYFPQYKRILNTITLLA